MVLTVWMKSAMNLTGKADLTDSNIKDFKLHAKTRFGRGSFIESVNFDYLEIQVIEDKTLPVFPVCSMIMYMPRGTILLTSGLSLYVV